jgi:hypothetical protein
MLADVPRCKQQQKKNRDELYGVPVAPLTLSPEQLAIKEQLRVTHTHQGGEAAQQLRVAFETLEVLSAVGMLRAGKGHDAGGLTCELLRVALLGVDAEEPQAGTVPVVPDVPSAGPASAALLDCLTQLLNSVRQAGPYPPTMAVGKLVPVPKKGCQAEDKGTLLLLLFTS